MEGIVINVMSKAKKPAQSRSISGHNYQVGKPTGNRDDSLKMYNFDILEMEGMETVQNYNKFIKQHMHVGYKALLHLYYNSHASQIRTHLSPVQYKDLIQKHYTVP